MKNLLKVGMIAFAFGLMFISVDSANAQTGYRNREARREYRSDVRDARQDFRRDRREARQEYRSATGRRYNNGYYTNNNRRISNGYYTSSIRRAYPQVRTRVYYRNGRRYIVRY
jgi:uncharacterized membrane protein